MKTLFENRFLKVILFADGMIQIVNKDSDQQDNFVKIKAYADGSIEIKAPNSFFQPTSEGFDVWLR